ncbi:glycoside hydrolase family 18 [Bacteroides sp.]|uniref:glycoside hydrolase family 18 n=1 Tax=Bacteroides sp. TaxID=29523 RepID=UPI0025874C83|nr:glycoside hydrolase family 18 [Bacteroides sp.]
MNKYILISIISAFAICLLPSCSKWTDTESKDFEDFGNSEEYYADLREWKSTRKDREITFGWFGNWTGVGASLANCMIGLPDSVDMISIWGEWHPHTITPAKRKDLETVQQQKGTLVLACSFTMNVGDHLTPEGVDQNEFWGWDNQDKVKQEAAIRKYAKAFVDSVHKANLDGFDIDHEPHFGGAGNLASYPDRMHIFISELGKYFGPKSGTNKILAIDGEPHSLLPETGEYLDYFIEQTYGASSDYTLDNNRISKCFNQYKDVLTPEQIAAKYIATENFENWALTGGVTFTRADGTIVRSLAGFAMWTPTYNTQQYRKGGVGTYHMEAEYAVPGKNGFYPFLREAIHIMNPQK